MHNTEININIKLDISKCIQQYDKIFPHKEYCLKGYISYDDKNGYFFDYNFKSCKDNLKWIRYSGNKYTYINSELLNNCKPILLFYEAIDEKKIQKEKIDYEGKKNNPNTQIQNPPFIPNNGRNMPIQNSNFGNVNNNNMNNNNMPSNNMNYNNMQNNNMNNNMFNNNMNNNNNINNNANQMQNNIMFNNANNMMNNNMNQQINMNSPNNSMMQGFMNNPMMMNNINNQQMFQMQQVNQMQQIQLQQQQLLQAQQMFQIQKQQIENQQQNMLNNCNNILDSMEENKKNNENNNLMNPFNDKNNIKLIFELVDEKKKDKVLYETTMYVTKTKKMNEIFEGYYSKWLKKKEDKFIKQFFFNDNEIPSTSTQTAEELNLKNDSKIKAIKYKDVAIK